jgi:nucleoside-diphosphate-sugar epimerase
VNIGAGEEHSIREFVAEICAQVGYSQDAIQYDTARYVGATSKCLDTSKVRALLPGYLRTPLAQGLRETIQWFRDERIALD